MTHTNETKASLVGLPAVVMKPIPKVAGLVGSWKLAVTSDWLPTEPGQLPRLTCAPAATAIDGMAASAGNALGVGAEAGVECVGSGGKACDDKAWPGGGAVEPVPISR